MAAPEPRAARGGRGGGGSGTSSRGRGVVALAVAAALALAGAPSGASAAATGSPFGADPVARAERLARRYETTPATETVVLLEEGPQTCVPNVSNVLGILPSACCGDMRCPLEGGICCKGNTHCCANGFMCVQGDPGTPPGCLDMTGKELPVAVHKLLAKQHMKIKVVQPAKPKPTVQVPGFHPSTGRLNYEDALAPAARNALTKMRVGDTTTYHRASGAQRPAEDPRAPFVLPNLPGFPLVPASAISGDPRPGDPGTPDFVAQQALEKARAAAVQAGVKKWTSPDGVRPVGGGVRDGGDSPLGQKPLRAYGNAPVVMLPESPERAAEVDRMVAGADDSISSVVARAELQGKPVTDDIINVKTVKATTRMGTASEAMAPDGDGDAGALIAQALRFRETGGQGEAGPRRPRREAFARGASSGPAPARPPMPPGSAAPAADEQEQEQEQEPAQEQEQEQDGTAEVAAAGPEENDETLAAEAIGKGAAAMGLPAEGEVLGEGEGEADGEGEAEGEGADDGTAAAVAAATTADSVPLKATTPQQDRAFDAAMLRSLFPPAPPVADRDPPRPPSDQEKTLARLQQQLDKVDAMRSELRAEMKAATSEN